MATDSKPKISCEQPLHAAQVQDATPRLQTVSALTWLGKTSIYGRIKTGEFKPLRLGSRSTRFGASDVQAWLQAQGK